jgi:hypothetical protein
MGIRYFAKSIDTDDYLRIGAGPCPTCGARPHTRERDYEQPEPDELDLDKSWHYLQRLFASIGMTAAAELVAGNVTNTWSGWISHQGTVAPDRVRRVAVELASVRTDQVRAQFHNGEEWLDERSGQDFDYVLENLAAAVRFTAKVASDNRGIVYYIG